MSKVRVPSPINGVADKKDTISPSEVMALLRGGKWVILATTAIVVLPVALYTFLSKPVYEATARVVVDIKEQQTIDFTGRISATKITNEIETLTSNAVTEGVATALAEKKYLDKAGRTIAPILLSSSEAVSPGTLVPIQEVTRRLLWATEVTPLKESDVIKISARSADPREAALIANTYTEVYTEFNISQSRTKSRAVREFLQSQVLAKQRLLDSAETSMGHYMASTGTVSLDAETNKMVGQLAQLEATRDAIGIDITTREKTLSSYQSQLTEQEPNIARQIGESSDAYIRLVQEQLAKLEVQRDLVIAQNPILQTQNRYATNLEDIDTQIAKLKKNLQTRTHEYLRTLSPSEGSEGNAGFLSQLKQKIIEQQIELEGLRAKRGALAAVIAQYEYQFNRLPRRSMDLAKLQRTRLSNEKLFSLVEEKFNEAAITEKSEFGYVNIMDPAIVPLAPVSPRVLYNLLVGVLLGLAFGVGIVFLRPVLTTTIRSPEDVQEAGYPMLAAITRMAFPRRKRTKANVEGNGVDMHLVAYAQSDSPLVESYRHLFTSLVYCHLEKPLRSVLVTSAKEDEGKTNTISNLAVVAAEAEKRVLLIDADLRRPAIHTMFGMPKDRGLMNLLGDHGSAGEFIHKNLLPNLDVLCAGPLPPNPSAVMRSARMRSFLADMAKVYDLVLVDSPPLFAVTDSLVLAALVDGVVLVASAGKTKVPELAAAVAALGNSAFLGVVLNNYDPRKAFKDSSRGYGYSYGYGTGSHKGDNKIKHTIPDLRGRTS